MCIHTLRFFHDACVHQSHVPPAGPGYIPPVKCPPVWQALEWYHSQPSRAPEMYPPPCPRPCHPVWGNEICQGNIRCVFRAGKCDRCNRAEELVVLARRVCDLIDKATKGMSLADEIADNLAPSSNRDEEYMKYWKLRFAALDAWLRSYPTGGCEGYLRSTVTHLFVENADIHVAARDAPFWVLYRDFLDAQLSVDEHARLGFFFLKANAGGGTKAPEPELAPPDRTNAAAEGKEASSEHAACDDCTTDSASVSTTLASPKFAHHRSLSDQGPTFHKFSRSDDYNRSCVSTPSLQSTLHHKNHDHKQCIAPGRKDGKDAEAILLAFKALQTSSSDDLTPQERQAVDEETSCSLAHPIGFLGPATEIKHTTQMFANIDRECAAERALAAARTVYDTLATNDTREDLCDASRGAYRSWA